MALRLPAPCAFALAVAVLAALAACDSSPARTPTTPTTSATSASRQTSARVIRLSGDVAFGGVEIGSYGSKEFTACNDGTSPLGIYGMRLPEPFWLGWDEIWEIGASVPPGECLLITVFFSPTALESYTGTAVVQGDYTSGTSTFQISGTGTRPPSPRTSFGEGRYLVGVGVASGRYYSEPTGECFWLRSSASGDWLASMSTWADPGQWMVDILPSDGAFESSGCGLWSQAPAGHLNSGIITPGVWEVRTQIPQGRYRTRAGAGCFWHRLKHFEGTPDGIIESGSLDRSAEISVSIRSTDVGFLASDACGTWTRVS